MFELERQKKVSMKYIPIQPQLGCTGVLRYLVKRGGGVQGYALFFFNLAPTIYCGYALEAPTHNQCFEQINEKY